MFSFLENNMTCKKEKNVWALHKKEKNRANKKHLSEKLGAGLIK